MPVVKVADAYREAAVRQNHAPTHGHAHNDADMTQYEIRLMGMPGGKKRISRTSTTQEKIPVS